MFKRCAAWRAPAQSWIKTLRLPQSNFPPRPEPALQSQFLKECADELYGWQASNRSAERVFTLHDGPPYANGDLHLGHALNKILKDIFNRFQLSQGKRIHYRPGWDCHGLPIELKALQQIQNSENRERLGPVALRDAAAKLAGKTVEEQKAGFRSWAVMGDWANAYRTMDRSFETKQLEIFQVLAQRGLVYRRNKPVYWSPSSTTALAEAELEYDDNHISQAAWVKFPMVELPSAFSELDNQKPVSALIWTTTPWTLPANRAIAVHPALEYCAVEWEGEYIVACSSRLSEIALAAQVPVESLTVALKGVLGRDLVQGSTYTNPFDTDHAPHRPLILAEYVTADAGTGLVHTAPGHGFEDYDACQAYGIDTAAPVDDKGMFTKEAFPDNPGILEGKFVLREGSDAVLDHLRTTKSSATSSLLWASSKYCHKYPIDWRTKQPVIIRATAQWFADVGDIKKPALEALDEVTFIPDTGKSRLRSFILGRNSWCISRQRAWGVPIPVLYRISDGQQEPVLTDESISHILKTISERGTDAWWTDAEDESKWVSEELPQGRYVRGKDTMDVWFDSGTTWTQLPHQGRSNHPLADAYVEGSDQHRGWFQSSLLTRVGSAVSQGTFPTPAAPFEVLITHGFILDEKGRKMSKSIGNVVSPTQIMNGTLLPPIKPKKRNKTAASSDLPSYDGMGVDALRLWVAKNDYTNDVPVGEQVLQAVNGALHKYRVTLKWLLGVLHDYDQHAVFSFKESNVSLDLSNRLALRHLTQIMERTRSAYAGYEPFRAMRELERYVNTRLSSFYFETAKDVLYTGMQRDRLAAQHVCSEILQGLLTMLAPVTPLMVAECMHYAPAEIRTLIRAQNGHPFEHTWEARPIFDDAGGFDLSLEEQDALIEDMRHGVSMAQEELRNKKKIGSSLESQVILRLRKDVETGPTGAFLSKTVATSELAQALVVSEVKLEEDCDSSSTTTERIKAGGSNSEQSYSISVERASAEKCPRCWRFAMSKQMLEGTEDKQEQICSRCQNVLNEMNV